MSVSVYVPRNAYTVESDNVVRFQLDTARLFLGYHELLRLAQEATDVVPAIKKFTRDNG